MLWILLLSIGLAGFALPGLSKSSGPRTNSPTDGGAAKPASVSPKHRNAPVHPIASQPDRTPAKRSDGSNGSPAGNSGAAASPQATARGPKIWLQGTRKLQATFTGTSKNRTASSANLSDAANLAQNNAAAMVLGAGQGQPLSIAKGDLDQDGIEDLVVGYATPAGPALTVYRGNLDAFAPQSDASFQAIGRGEFPSPFLPEAHVVTVPVNPDFIVTGNFIPGGFQDIVIAGRGGNALYLLPGDGKGNFGAPQILSIPGTVTSLAAGEFGDSSLGIKLFVGTSDPKNGFGLSVFNFSDGALSTLGSYHLNGAASNVEFGDFGDSGTDVAFLSGGQINIVRPSLQLEQVSLPVSASAFALGSFIYDRNGGSQIAVLGSDGSINIAARTEFNPRLFTAQEFQAIRHAGLHHQASPLLPARSFPVNGWKIVESFPSVATADSSQAPLFFRTRVSNNGSDDVMWLNSSSEQMAVISHPSSQPGAATFVPGNVSVVPYSGTPLHAMPMRINVDGRPGIVALHQGDPAPYMVMPIPDPTFTVNRFDDPVPVSPITNACNGVANDCSLREAVLKANGDTIMLPAGTYNLTIGRPAAPDYTGNHGALYVNNSATIVGAGQNSTIIQWGIPSSGTVDMIMAVNE